MCVCVCVTTILHKHTHTHTKSQDSRTFLLTTPAPLPSPQTHKHGLAKLWPHSWLPSPVFLDGTLKLVPPPSPPLLFSLWPPTAKMINSLFIQIVRVTFLSYPCLVSEKSKVWGSKKKNKQKPTSTNLSCLISVSLFLSHYQWKLLRNYKIYINTMRIW